MIHKAEFTEHKLHYNGKIYRGTDKVGQLCRILKTGTLEIYQGKQPHMVFDVEIRAKKRLTEEDRNGFAWKTPI